MYVHTSKDVLIIDLDPLSAKTKKHMFYITERQVETTSLTLSDKVYIERQEKHSTGKTYMHVHEEQAKKRNRKEFRGNTGGGSPSTNPYSFCVVRETYERDVDRRWNHRRKPLFHGN
uniref:Uncharacterized protein n=1 Tax=Cucumis melo TaxID=3656 RepID=A0A9I9CFJ4_CUCME